MAQENFDMPRGLSRFAVGRRVKESIRQSLEAVSAIQQLTEFNDIAIPIPAEDVDDYAFDNDSDLHSEADSEIDIADTDTDAAQPELLGQDNNCETDCINSDYDSNNSDSSSSDSDQCDLNDFSSVNSGVPLSTLLAEWAIDNNVSTTAVHSLFAVLKPFHPELPRDPRTLLRTPTGYQIKNMTEGHYYHFGISSGIECIKRPISGIIQLQFNVDGLPLFKSSKLELWPILCLVFGGDSHPFVVGIYCGHSKPKKLDEFLYDLIKLNLSYYNYLIVVVQ